MKTFELFFDESGNFEEAPLLDGCDIVRAELPQSGASQLVGVLAPAGVLTPTRAEEILRGAHRAANLSLGRRCHASELIKAGQRAQYETLLDAFLARFADSGLQPVRLYNQARLGFGDKVATYTCMVAELAVRILEALSRAHGGRIALDITAAIVLLNGHDKTAAPIFIDESEYKSRLNEQITFAAVRHGVAHNRSQWNISGFRFGSGLKDRPLQLCDLLSNASYRNFRNCTAAQKSGMKRLLGEFDFVLNRADVLDEIAHHSKDGSLAHALQTAAENWARPELEQNVRQGIHESCSSLVRRLAVMPAIARDIHLRQLSEWGSQFLVVRDLELADRMLRWLEEQVAEPLLKSAHGPAAAESVWFLAQLLMQRLGLHNHRGELLAAREVSARLQELFPALAGQWEHAALVTEAITLRAVHLNDCCEYDEASRIMATVAEFYGGLSSLMSDALPGVFPDRVRSRQRGMALGTRMQSEMYAGLADSGRLATARELNEQAMDEFLDPGDRLRQFQYRAQIETSSGNLVAARDWLARSLECSADAHADIAQAIVVLEGADQGFALLHWSRIAMEAARQGDAVELAQFLATFGAGLHNSAWLTSTKAEYPAHGILRHVAVAYAAAGMQGECRKAIDKLHLLPTKGKGALALIKFSGIVEALSHWGRDKGAEVRKVMTRSPSLVAEIRATIDGNQSFQAFTKVAASLEQLWYQAESSLSAERKTVAAACRLVGQ